MKQILLAGVAALSVTVAATSAQAADYSRVRPAAVSPVYAPAPSGTYLSIFGGAAFSSTVVGQYFGSSDLDLQMDTGFTIGATLGTHLMPNLRAEAEVSYIRHNVSDDCFMAAKGGWCSNPPSDADGTVSTVFLLANAWWDLNMGGGFTPYIGGGVGAAIVTPDLTLYSDPTYFWNETRFSPAAQLGVGVSWGVSPGMVLDLGYRLKAVFGTTFAGGDCVSTTCSATDVQWVENVVQLGLRF